MNYMVLEWKINTENKSFLVYTVSPLIKDPAKFLLFTREEPLPTPHLSSAPIQLALFSPRLQPRLERLAAADRGRSPYRPSSDPRKHPALRGSGPLLPQLQRPGTPAWRRPPRRRAWIHRINPPSEHPVVFSPTLGDVSRWFPHPATPWRSMVRVHAYYYSSHPSLQLVICHSLRW